jgi:anti-sigma regulatory factor (Ser/Thr protein kinase)
VDALSGPVVEDVAWVRVDEPSAVGSARRAVEQLARQLGAADVRVAEIGLAVTEIASNVQRHGGGGAVLLRAVRAADDGEIEVVALDSGPGIADVSAALRDRSSTAGTLGIGMGAIARMARSLEIATTPERGTVLVARFDLGRRRPATPQPRPDDTAGITRALAGEDVCGDAYATRPHGRGLTLMVADGSGHGPLAASASSAAVRAFLLPDRDRAAEPPAEVLSRVHGALSGTRGAAVAVAEIDPHAEIVRFAGVGNIAGAVLHAGGKRSMVSLGGVAGYRNPTIRTFEYAYPPGAVVVMHSDGVRSRWSEADVRGLVGRAPLLLAATLLRDAGIRHDDACVLVGRAAS